MSESNEWAKWNFFLYIFNSPSTRQIFPSVFMQAWQEEIGPRHDKEKTVDEAEEKQYSVPLPQHPIFKSGQIRERI